MNWTLIFNIVEWSHVEGSHHVNRIMSPKVILGNPSQLTSSILVLGFPGFNHHSHKKVSKVENTSPKNPIPSRSNRIEGFQNPILIIGFHQRNPCPRVFLDSQGEFSQFGCFLKWWYPQNTPKWSFLVGKPMVVGYHHFRNPPFGFQGTHPWHFALLRSTTIHHLPLATRHPVTPHAMLRHEKILIPWPGGVTLQSTRSPRTPGGQKNSPKGSKDPRIGGSKVHMGVSKNKSTPKWMVYKRKPY